MLCAMSTLTAKAHPSLFSLSKHGSRDIRASRAFAAIVPSIPFIAHLYPDHRVRVNLQRGSSEGEVFSDQSLRKQQDVFLFGTVSVSLPLIEDLEANLSLQITPVLPFALPHRFDVDHKDGNPWLIYR